MPNSSATDSDNYRTYRPVMPRPGQPGAMQFDGKNITEFLEEWNIECEDFGLDERQRCARFPNYCVPSIKETVKLLPGYVTSNWATLQDDLRKLYWPHDTPKNSMSALNKVIQDAPSMDLNVYVLKYTSISQALVTAHALSPLDRVTRLLDGLTDELRRKVIRYCTKEDWKLSSQDTGTKDPEFDKITEFILTEARTNQTMAVYSNERSVRERNGTSETVNNPAMPPVATPAPATTTMLAQSVTPAPDPIAELTKQFAQLALALQANMIGHAPTTSSPNVSAPSSGYTNDRPFRCVWCDSTGHARRDCPEFAEALGSRQVTLNEKGRVLHNGSELPLMYGKGGMKRLVTPVTPMSTSVESKCITLENYGNLGPEPLKV